MFDDNPDTRAFVRSMFRDENAPAETDGADLTQGNVVPREGRTPPSPPRDKNRDFVRQFFGLDIN